MPTSTQEVVLKHTAPFNSYLHPDYRTNTPNPDTPLENWQKEAMERLENQPFPSRKDENWKYTSVARILAPRYQKAPQINFSLEDIQTFLPENLESYRLVFINGRLAENLSDFKNLEEGLQIRTLSASTEWDETTDAQFKKLVQEENAFVLLNTATSSAGVAIQISRNSHIQKPVHIMHLAAPAEDPFMTAPLCLVDAGQSSSCTLLETYHTLGNPDTAYFTNAVNRVNLGTNSRFIHYRLQNENEQAFQVSNTSVWQEKDSTYSGYQIDLGARLVRNNLNANLQNAGTHTDMYGIYLAEKEQHIDNQTFIDHAFPHCTSNELYKGIITDKGRGVFNGKVIVRQDAQKTNAFQQNSSLVLSPEAIMDTKPQLEIFADDVRCSHGATIGQLDENALFYLRSRGLNETDAKVLLQFAFVMEVLESVAQPQLYSYFEKFLHEKFSN